jgi:poly [ADP-ribose] polymerase
VNKITAKNFILLTAQKVMANIKSYVIGDPDEPGFGENYKVVNHIVLNFTDINNNNNKFYSMELQESGGGCRIFTHYGRVGAPGTKEGRYFLKSEHKPRGDKSLEEYVKEEAEREFQSLLNSKKKKGYVPVEVAVANVGSGKAKPVLKNISMSSLDCRVEKFVGQIYEEASKTLASIIRTPIGALTESQINKGFEKLWQIRKAIKYFDNRLLTELSSQFYSLIPQKFSRRIDAYEAVIDTNEKADRQEEVLQLMRDVYNVREEFDSDIKAKYKAINTKIEPLESSDSEYKRIEDKVEVTHSRHHPIRLHIDNIFRIELNSAKGRFNPKKLSTMELFHGSPNKNILGILQRGLLIAPPDAQTNGAAFGRGIYFARHSTKSAQYSTRFCTNMHKNGFLLAADVAVGRMQKVSYFTFNDKGLSPSYDSVMGVAGFDLIHDEYVVYNVNQVELKYVIDFTPKSRY